MPMPYTGPVGNNVLETANAPGTASTINLGGAPSGWTGFVAAFGTGKTVFYFITDGVQSEWGTGTVTAGSLNTLSRGVAGNSQGTAQRLNFTGAVQVYSAIPAEWQPFFDASNGTLPMGGRRLATLGAGVAPEDGARLDQVAWRRLGNVVIAAPQVSAIFSLPPALSRFRLEWSGLRPDTSAGLGLVFSMDNGASFRGGATDYDWVIAETRGGSAGNYFANGFFMLQVGLGNAAYNFGSAEFTAYRQTFSQNQSATGAPAVLSASFGSGVSRFSGAATHVALLFGGANMAEGQIGFSGAV